MSDLARCRFIYARTGPPNLGHFQNMIFHFLSFSWLFIWTLKLPDAIKELGTIFWDTKWPEMDRLEQRGK